LFTDGIIERVFQEHIPYIEYATSGTRKRQIPLSSFEMIIDMRIREIFEIIRRTLLQRKGLIEFGGGGVLTGGGALFCRSSVLFREVFGVNCRVGHPLEVAGAATGLTDPRYSAVWGALRIAAYFNAISAPADGMSRTIDVLDSLLSKARRSLLSLRGSFKV
jgi:cell division protein FtsA